MTVTRIDKLNSRNRYRIYVDGSVFCVLYGRELSEYGIREDAELSDETYERIRSEVLIRRARLRAMNLLMKHSFTERKLRDKLAEGEYPEDIVDDALEYVIGYGYVDDYAYARDYITGHCQDRSARRLVGDLISKGIERDTIELAMREAAEAGDTIDEETQIIKLLKKRGFEADTADAAQLRKTYAYLSGRGYSTEAIHRAMRGVPDADVIVV